MCRSRGLPLSRREPCSGQLDRQETGRFLGGGKKFRWECYRAWPLRVMSPGGKVSMFLETEIIGCRRIQEGNGKPTQRLSKVGRPCFPRARGAVRGRGVTRARQMGGGTPCTWGERGGEGVDAATSQRCHFWHLLLVLPSSLVPNPRRGRGARRSRTDKTLWEQRTGRDQGREQRGRWPAERIT